MIQEWIKIYFIDVPEIVTECTIMGILFLHKYVKSLKLLACCLNGVLAALFLLSSGNAKPEVSSAL